MDFLQINVKATKQDGLVAYPDFIVGRSNDLMVRAKNFYAIWDEAANLWSTDEYKVQELVDAKLREFADKNKDVTTVKWMRNFSSNGQSTFRKYLSQIGDHYHQLDESLTFLSTKVKKKDFVSKRLPYDIAPGDHSAWDELISVLYKPEQREKIEWFIGAIVSGESKTIQKFLVLHGPPGAGKGTVITIVEKLFPGYIATFNAKELGMGNQFASAAFANNPLVAIQHDGDLSRIEDNTTLNSIVSHEIMKVNEKYKPSYDTRLNAALIMGTNKPVKITDAQSGLIRRLIDVHPSGVRLSPKEYWHAMDRIEFQLGAIAQHCLDTYKRLGKNYYSNYQPLEMMFKTNAFFNFVETHYDLFKEQDGVSAKQAWNLYKEYCQEFGIDKPMSNYAFKSELGNYFEDFHERITLDGVLVRSYYQGFKGEPFKTPVDDDSKKFILRLDETVSLLNLELADQPAQYAKANGSPSKYWDDRERLIDGVLRQPKPNQIVSTYLRDLDPYQEHYVKVPENLLCVDFDLRDENGEKSLEKNLEAAALWPATYGEISKGGNGVHLHYYYDGDISQLDPNYADGIEVKVFTGNSALRRRLSKCNNVAIAILTATSGILPLKEKKRVLDVKQIQGEKGLRRQIEKALAKEIHPGTKSNIDYIKMILDEAYEANLQFNVTDMQDRIIAFAQRSTNQPIQALRVVNTMRWKSEEQEDLPAPPAPKDDRLVFIDVESYPNLFVICWKFEEDDPSKDSVVTMINPKPHEVEALFRFKLVGFNVRNYDNHMLWGAALGMSPQQLYQLSQKIINGAPGARFGEAYNVSYTDIYDYATKKQGLKKWQIALGLNHQEMDIPWDQPVPEDRILDVADYCANDVVSTEMVHKYLQGDWKARLILADLSGLSPNQTTANHTARIIFGGTKNPQRDFVYTKLDKEFPGYVFESGKSIYRGETVGEGGYVYAEPGMYKNVALLDVASMHPTSIGQLNLFGDEYTPRFMALVEAQLAIKRGDYDAAKELLGGKLRPYIEEIEALGRDTGDAKKAAAELRYGLKIAINIVYGLTSAKFDNPFKDFRNVDNIVAKRGALFMIDLKHYVQELGYTVAHIKTDSIKIPDATPEIIEMVKNFAGKYGYDMEHEDTYEKFALLNDAVYVAKKNECEWAGVDPHQTDKTTYDYHKRLKAVCWTATGTQFLPEANPYVFKKLFGYGDSITFYDLGVTKSVAKGKMFLDFGFQGDGYLNAALEAVKAAEKAVKAAEKSGPDALPAAESQRVDATIGYHEALKQLVFVGKTGRFTPVRDGFGGGQLWRVMDDKPYAVAGTKGHLWVDSNVALDLPDDAIDYDYFEKQVEEAREDLAKFVEGSPFESLEDFLS